MSEVIKLYVDGKEFKFWQDVTITRAIDSFDSFTFTAPFDYRAEGFKENFMPFTFKPVVIAIDDENTITGTLVHPKPKITSDAKLIEVAGYSKPGVLMDCTAPASAMPLEYNKMNLRDIAARLAGYFNISVDFRGDPGPVFDRVACDPSQKIFDFLTDLSKQRGFVISNNTSGDLVFWKAEQGSPVAVMMQGESPIIEVTPEFDPQKYFSEITGIETVEVGRSTGKATVKAKTKGSKDPNAKPAPKKKEKKKKVKPPKKYSKFSLNNGDAGEVFRPLIYKVDDVEGASVQSATKAEMARMMGNVMSVSVEVSTWRDQNGNLWAPNTRVKLKAPDAFIFDYFIFDITQVDLNKSGDVFSATLKLSLPGAFSGEPPEIFPWEL